MIASALRGCDTSRTAWSALRSLGLSVKGGSTMKAALKVLGLALVFALVTAVQAEEKKEVTLKGTIACSKCGLKETEDCGNAIVVKEGDKEVVYYFMDKGKKEKYHKEICTAKKMGTVKGVVSEKDGKKWITPSKDGVKFED
jgi:hypothetical protein